MLPKSEKLRIKEEHSDFEIFPEFQPIAIAQRSAAEDEAELWYERMGKFAEMAGAVTIGDERYIHVSMVGFWYCNKDKAALTTPELITEFLNQLNEGK